LTTALFQSLSSLIGPSTVNSQVSRSTTTRTNWRFFIEVPLRLKSASQIDGTHAAPLSAQCSGLFFKIRRHNLLGFGEQSRDGGSLFVVNVTLYHRLVMSDIGFDDEPLVVCHRRTSR
jgi:hypothetical protein